MVRHFLSFIFSLASALSTVDESEQDIPRARAGQFRRTTFHRLSQSGASLEVFRSAPLGVVATRAAFVPGPRLAGQIDYRLLLYEAVIGLVALTLLFLLLCALEISLRRIAATAKVEIILMGTRIRNWRRQDSNRPTAGPRL
jgi:hypothetical protein